MLAIQAGHEIDLGRIDPQAWNGAAKASYYRQDYRSMRDVIAGAIVERAHKD